MTEILEIFKSYNGTGYYCILFIASLLYLWFCEEDKHIKAILVIIPSVIQVLFFIPYIYLLYNRLDEGTYYRILWLLPMTLVIAYAGVKVIGTHTRLGVVTLAVILILSGTCVYTSAGVRKAENAYKLPEEVITICDMIRPEEGKERVWAVFPPMLVHYVRQYTTDIQLAYGRDSMVESWKRLYNPLYELYMSSEIPADELTQYSNEYLCNYVIIDKEKGVTGSLEDYNMTLVGETTNYEVYRNLNVPMWDDVPLGNYYVQSVYSEE